MVMHTPRSVKIKYSKIFRLLHFLVSKLLYEKCKALRQLRIAALRVTNCYIQNKNQNIGNVK